jgi:DNA-binding beta-propeller fold protein YncE
VSKFNFAGILRTTWGSGHDGNANGEFIYPAALAVDSLGNIFVADTYNNRIQSFSGTWESYDCSGQGGLNKPFGIAVDSSGNVYVADTYKHRILKYKYTLSTVVIDGSDSGVANKVLNDGSSLTSRIAQCAGTLVSHADFVSSVTRLTNDWRIKGIITAKEADRIESCAANSTIGR